MRLVATRRKTPNDHARHRSENFCDPPTDGLPGSCGSHGDLFRRDTKSRFTERAPHPMRDKAARNPQRSYNPLCARLAAGPHERPCALPVILGSDCARHRGRYPPMAGLKRTAGRANSQALQSPVLQHSSGQRAVGGNNAHVTRIQQLPSSPLQLIMGQPRAGESVSARSNCSSNNNICFGQQQQSARINSSLPCTYCAFAYYRSELHRRFE